MPNDVVGGIVIALNAPLFWITVFAAILLLMPVVDGTRRRRVFCVINLSFLFALLGWLFLWWPYIPIAHALLSMCQKPYIGTLAAIILATTTFTFFLIHKGALANPIAAAHFGEILSVVGFSFIFLRIIEVSRAVTEGRHGAPPFSATVNYLVPFHMLAAGPIQSYDDFVAVGQTTGRAEFQGAT